MFMCACPCRGPGGRRSKTKFFSRKRAPVLFLQHQFCSTQHLCAVTTKTTQADAAQREGDRLRRAGAAAAQVLALRDLFFLFFSFPGRPPCWVQLDGWVA